MWLDIIFIVAGFVLLIFGANWLVDGASSLAKRMGVSALTIGLTVVALGTSAPELAINIISSVSRNTDIALGNIVGSNIFNIFLILGVAAMVRPMDVDRSTTKVDIPFNLLIALLLFVLVNDVLIDGEANSCISRIDGFVLLMIFAVFLYYNFQKGHGEAASEHPVEGAKKGWFSVLMVLGGLALLVAGGKAIVEGAVNVAERFGVSQAIIGLTIVAAGTSLPELATSVIAAYKNEPDIAIGNVVGSCIFNMSFVLGISSIITPIPAYAAANVDLLMNVGACLALLFFALIGRGRKISRTEGVIMTAIFLIYLAYLISIAK